jgi:hypothetical protein
MKSALGLFICLITLFSFTNAQTSKDLKNPDLNTFNFNFINGYAISYNYLTTDNFWLRAQLDLFLSGEDMEGESDQSYTSTSGGFYGSRREGDDNYESKYLGISLSTQILFPLYKSEYGFIYFGAGPKFTYSSESRFSDSDDRIFSPDTVLVPSTNKYSSEVNYKDYDIGILGLIGISAAITDNISLYVETHFSGGLRWTDSKFIYKTSSNSDYEDVNESNDTANGWFYEARFIRLGVTISI